MGTTAETPHNALLFYGFARASGLRRSAHCQPRKSIVACKPSAGYRLKKQGMNQCALRSACAPLLRKPVMPKRAILKIRLCVSFILVRPFYAVILTKAQGQKVKVKIMSVYFGGSRSQSFSPCQIVGQVVPAVLTRGQSVHVGCQFGADQAVIYNTPAKSLSVFAVAPSLATCPPHVQVAASSGARVVLAAGGITAPIYARYLLRSIAAFQGCECAVFFSPGSGSLAVARECVRSGLPVFAFSSLLARVPSVSGQWVSSSFVGFSCWQWSTPTQQKLF